MTANDRMKALESKIRRNLGIIDPEPEPEPAKPAPKKRGRKPKAKTEK